MGTKCEGPAIEIDLEITYTCVSVWQHNRVEIIANNQGNRTKLSSVAFKDTERLIGNAAKNQYDVKLLAVDIPLSTGPDQRLYLIGDEEEYRVGGGLISELRDPVIKVMAASKEFDHRDDQEDAERELQEAERNHREEIDKLEKS